MRLKVLIGGLGLCGWYHSVNGGEKENQLELADKQTGSGDWRGIYDTGAVPSR